jgi:hypothetical protein
MESVFGKWFDAQFPKDTRFADLTDDVLGDMVAAGKDAEWELLNRRVRREQERAALYAWQAAPQVTPQVPRK